MFFGCIYRQDYHERTGLFYASRQKSLGKCEPRHPRNMVFSAMYHYHIDKFEKS